MLFVPSFFLPLFLFSLFWFLHLAACLGDITVKTVAQWLHGDLNSWRRWGVLPHSGDVERAKWKRNASCEFSALSINQEVAQWKNTCVVLFPSKGKQRRQQRTLHGRIKTLEEQSSEKHLTKRRPQTVPMVCAAWFVHSLCRIYIPVNWPCSFGTHF